MFVILLALWLVFAGSVTVTNLILGVLVAGLITLLCTKFMGYSTKRFYTGLKKAPAVAGYIGELLKEIVIANRDVLRVIYRKGQPQSTLVRFHTDLRSEGLRVLVANSITLTPGTYTVKLEGDEYAVHALDKSFQEDIENSAFFKLARKMEES
ncbi:MAG: Na+/H+ antiporter subunit E [Oscillospiraceae bacterium]|nr:Na+/H+ antiporter subunit E [Oscillospiraceae bacterium]